MPSKSGELQKAQLDIGRLTETWKSAEKEKARAESELFVAKSRAKELALEIEKSNARATARKLELGSSRKLETEDHKYSELMRELNSMKKELGWLKLDMANALESKAKAEKTIEASDSRVISSMKSAEEISRKIDEANEEHVLVELARIEAEREYREIEAQRVEEAARFSKEIEATRQKIGALQKEINEAKDLEMKLAVTNSDLNVLQSEMELVRAMEKNFRKNGLVEESESRSLLKITEDELKAAKNELAKIREESFHYMTSMDVVRTELLHIASETEQLKKQERKADASIQELNSRLVNAKSKLESASTAEERSRAIVSNLSAGLQQLHADTKALKKEKDMIDKETTRTRDQTELNENEICSAEDRLQAAMLDLEAAKASEALALKRLRVVAERTMKSRAASFAQSSVVTISRSEYEYLTTCAASAQQVADNKIAAAQAWTEALKAEEKQILMTTESLKKEIKELKITEDKELSKIEKALDDQEKALETDSENTEEPELLEFQIAAEPPKRSARISTASARKAKMRRSSVSSGVRYHARAPSITVKRRKTVMPNLIKFLQKGSTANQK